MIQITHLYVEVEGVTILKDIHMDITDGEVHVLLGPNGSGKTALVMTIMGYPQYKIVSGSISCMGRDLSDLGITQRARLGIGLMEQRPPAINGVKQKMLLDYLLEKNPEQKDEIDRLSHVAKMRPLLYRDINRGLSGGEIKKSEILLLLARQPLFAMLDEPDSGVDIDSLGLLCTMITMLFTPDKAYPVKRKTGLIITHSSRILRKLYADKAHVMLDGRIVCTGNPQIIIGKIEESGFDSCITCKRKNKTI